MPKPRIVRFAESWTPDPKDPYGEDKRRLIRYLLDNAITVMNPRPIQAILDLGLFERSVPRGRRFSISSWDRCAATLGRNRHVECRAVASSRPLRRPTRRSVSIRGEFVPNCAMRGTCAGSRNARS